MSTWAAPTAAAIFLVGVTLLALAFSKGAVSFHPFWGKSRGEHLTPTVTKFLIVLGVLCLLATPAVAFKDAIRNVVAGWVAANTGPHERQQEQPTLPAPTPLSPNPTTQTPSSSGSSTLATSTPERSTFSTTEAEPAGTIDVPPPPLEPQYLMKLGAIGQTNLIVETGSFTVHKQTFANSIGLCSDLQNIPNIYCDGTTQKAWADFNVPANVTKFSATIGYSDRSPTDCVVKLDVVIIGGDTLFSETLNYGDYFPLTKAIPSSAGRLRVQITPNTGMRCVSILGDAAFLP